MLVLDNSSTYSKNILDQLDQKEVIALLINRSSIEQIQKKPLIVEIFREVDRFSQENGVIGFHCTKEIQSRPYNEFGLRILDMKLHHMEFIEYLKTEMSLANDKIVYIKEKLDYFRMQETGRREGLLWFCLNRSLVKSKGTEGFFEYYGGEAINFWYRSDPIIGHLCKKIGRAVVVEALINISQLTIYSEYGLGKCLVSNYAHALNKKFQITHLQGHVKSNISCASIIKVHPRDSFV
ncbi:hypothetical protein [Leptospira borgpetersenii]|uniref:hypothetical protein n=1 Tax=Leptospira borgpetersenii TaxID=174 RepID=UPI000773ED2E|nr:hypothetical protein [Leptospira borgpetersenii]